MLKNHTFFRRLCAFWAVLTLLFAFALPAFADTGPKPSVEISFRNLPDTACFATLLSKERSTGPASAWDGDPDDLPQTDDPAQAAWNAFAQYRDRDGFFFLQQVWQVTDGKSLHWGYYPPRCFKVLLWFPETKAYVCSEALERYAFDSVFTATLQGGALAMTAAQEAASAPTLNVVQSGNTGHARIGLAARIAITLFTELGVALLFGLRRKGQLGLIAAANIVTQLLLNLSAQLLWIPTGPAHYVIGYLLLEALVFALETGIYCLLMPKVGAPKRRKGFYTLYALVANAVSFGTGLLLAHWAPALF